MPFNNSGEANFYGPYNDVAGSQFNNSQIVVLSSTSTALIPRTLANLPSIIDSPATLAMRTSGVEATIGQTIIMPKSKPFQDFIAIILKLQMTLYPIIEVIGETQDLRALSQELSRTLMTTALTGRIIDLFKTCQLLSNLVWCRRLTDKVGRSIYTLRELVEAVVQYQCGVRRRLTGSAEEQLRAAKAHFVNGERDIDGIAREAFRKLIDCTNPLERFLCCAGLFGQLGAHSGTLWQDLSAELHSHLTIPRFRSPHGMITVEGDIYPFDSYTTYSDLCTLLGMHYGIHGWVNTATEQLLSAKHLSRLIQQRPAPCITVEPVYTCQVIGDSGQDSICPHCGSESSFGDWRVCLSCGLRFQTTAPIIPGDNWLESAKHLDNACYVMAMHFDLSILSSVKHLSGEVINSAMALRFLRLLSNVHSPIRHLYLGISHPPSIHIPDGMDTGSSPLILQHLTDLTLSSFNEIFDLPTVSLPQITQMGFYLLSMPDLPVTDWLLTFRSVTQLRLALKWDDALGSIQQLLLGLPALLSLDARHLPCITTYTLAQITETVRGIRAHDHPICYVKVVYLDQAELELPNPWTGTYPFLTLYTSRL